MRWLGVPNTNIQVSEDGQKFQWTFDREGAEFLAVELYSDGTGKEMLHALDFADELQRIHADQERFGIAIVMIERGPS